MPMARPFETLGLAISFLGRGCSLRIGAFNTADLEKCASAAVRVAFAVDLYGASGCLHLPGMGGWGEGSYCSLGPLKGGRGRVEWSYGVLLASRRRSRAADYYCCHIASIRDACLFS